MIQEINGINLYKDNVAVIILAAGMGKRMKSTKAKVLHEILSKPMILYVLETAIKIAGKNVILIIGNQSETVREVVSKHYEAIFSLQKNQLGTGHAVLCGLPDIPVQVEQVIVLCGDVPLISVDTVKQLLFDHIKSNRDISLIGVEIENPTGYGRILIDQNRNVTGIVEETDATEEQRKIRTINSGIYCIKKRVLEDSLQKITPHNVQGEMYLTDIIGIGYKEGKKIGAIVIKDADEVIGVNTYEDLKKAEAILLKKCSGKIS